MKGRSLMLAAVAVLFLSPVLHAEETSTESASDTPVTRAELQGLLDGLNEQIQTHQTDLDKLKRFKFSGYVQARIEAGEASNDTVKVSGSPATFTTANLSRFYIRRARLKLTYDASPLSQAVIYLDGGQDRSIRLLEGYVTLMDPWTPLHAHQLTMGQFNVPFGFEIERSSSVRELPERSRAENVLFSGERDRGVKLEDQWSEKFKTSLALLNGGGINSADYPTTDPTRGKDFVGRARWSQGVWDLAGSYYFGRQVTALTGPDVWSRKTRVGLDGQLFFSVPRLGGTTLRGEFYQGHEANPDSAKALLVSPTTGNPVRLLKGGANADHLATDMLGWYAMAVQNLGDRTQFVVRYDAYDPNTDRDHDQYKRLSLGVNAFYDGYTRLTVSYDAITTDSPVSAGRFRDPKDNLWTFQLQHKF